MAGDMEEDTAERLVLCTIRQLWQEDIRATVKVTTEKIKGAALVSEEDIWEVFRQQVLAADGNSESNYSSK